MQTGFEVKLHHEDQHQSIPKIIGNLANVFCTSGPHLVILARIVDEIWCGQTQNGVNLEV